VFNNTVGRTRVVEHRIRLTNEKPVALYSYPYSKEKTDLISSMIRDMEEQGMIEPSISPCAAPIVLTSKEDYASTTDV